MLLESLSCHQLPCRGETVLWLMWLVNPAPAAGSLELSLPSATLSGGFYLPALAPAQTAWEDSDLSCSCGDAELGAFPGRFVVL